MASHKARRLVLGYLKTEPILKLTDLALVLLGCKIYYSFAKNQALLIVSVGF